MTDRPNIPFEPYSIEYKDDKKEKWQSHEYHFNSDIGPAQMSADAWIQTTITAYGSSRNDSRKEMIDALKHFRSVISAAISDLEDENGNVS
jgi:hypothetical protein